MKRLLNKAAIVFRLAAYDFKAVYAGSVLGSVWAIAEPLVTIAVYWFVYTVAFGGGDVNGIPYYLWLSIGMSAWFFVSSGLKSITTVFRDYSYLLKKIYFDKRFLPGIRAISAICTHIIFLTIVLVVCAVNGIFPDIIYLLAVMIISIFFIYYAGKVLAFICGKFKDVQNIIGVVLNVGFWITPVFWIIDGKKWELYRFIMMNPAAIITEAYRAAIIPEYTIEWIWILYLAFFSFFMALIGKIMEKSILPDIVDGL